jgi:hypothetical protein
MSDDNGDLIGRALFLLGDMDVPRKRVVEEDWRWLARNLHIRNGSHPDFPEVQDILRKLIRSQTEMRVL